MIPTKAYIIRITDPISQEYAKTAAESCERIGIQYEFFEGVEKSETQTDLALCASLSHANLWNLIYERKECAIILEHDAIMLHKVSIDIPDNMIVALGFKLKDPSKYNHISAGPSTIIWQTDRHHGAHAYAITHFTAKLLLDELEEKGIQGAVDNIYFMKGRRTKVPLGLADPVSALAWLRKSTIWDESAEYNYSFTRSFYSNLKQ